MKKNYFLYIITLFAFFAVQVYSAQNTSNQNSIEENIADLSIYPNPVDLEQGTINITSKLNNKKFIEFYDVLGKKILSSNMTGRKLNISNLKKGVYILRITENGKRETRKLVVR